MKNIITIIDMTKWYFKWGTFKKDGEIHVAPATVYGLTNHELNRNCFCSPQLVYKDSYNGKELWNHNPAS